MNDYQFRKFTDADKEAVTSIFNYYIENSLAAYPQKKMGPEFFVMLNQMVLNNTFYVLENSLKEVVGFGLLHYLKKMDTFKASAEVSYFLLPGYNKQGLGTELLTILTREAQRLGILTLFAEICSKNEASLNFHLKNGFHECGRFEKVGNKNGTIFDIVWMQKFI